MTWKDTLEDLYTRLKLPKQKKAGRTTQEQKAAYTDRVVLAMRQHYMKKLKLQKL